MLSEYKKSGIDRHRRLLYNGTPMVAQIFMDGGVPAMHGGRSNRTVVVGALIWYAGGIALSLKGWQLVAAADTLQPGKAWPWLSVAAGLTIGSIKAKYLFADICRKNLDRIGALEEPGIWQCFRPRFFLFLLVMIAVGAALARLARENYPLLIAVSLLDISIATALFGSSYVFWASRPAGK